MRKILLILVASLLASPALAQTVDWCASPLSVQADPNTALVWRLRCTIQILDRERMEAVDHATSAEVDKAVGDAHLNEMAGQVGELKKKMEEAAKPVEPVPAAPAPPPPPTVLK
jgi:hypothetical protein